MPPIDEPDTDEVVEACIEELDELITNFDCYPLVAIAVAMGIYLEGLLGALLDEHQCTIEDVRRLLREIESGVLQSQVLKEV